MANERRSRMIVGANRVAASVIIMAMVGIDALGQNADAPEPAPGQVVLNFPDDVEVKVLIDYVAKRQGVNFIYDEQIGAKKITIKATQPVPASSLLVLLDSALKMKGLVLEETNIPGTMRIETARQLTTLSQPTEDASTALRPTVAVTRVFALKHAAPQRVEQALTPFLSGATANVTALADMVIITDYADNLPRIERLMALIDRPGREVVARFVTVSHLEAESLAQKVTEFLTGKAKASGSVAAAAGAALAADVTLVADARTNQVAVFGTAGDVDEALKLIESLDVPLGLETRVHALTVVSPQRIDELVRKMIGEVAAKRLYHSVTEGEANLLIVTTTPEIHRQIETIRQSLDKPREESQSPVRFYKLENANAADVLATLQTIEGDTGLEDVSIDGVSADPAEGGSLPIQGPTEAEVNVDQAGTAIDAGASPPERRSVRLRDARVIADEPTNTIIVVGEPSVHLVYERLIRRLDARRPQVLIEATVVAIDTTNGFSLGVEIHGSNSVDGGQLLNFTQFGLTTKDSLPGNLTLSPGIGFTGALIDADVAEFVIRALESDTRARVVSRPSILINDNASGTLLSEAEEPFESVNASNTVATTSFAGFASAGTNIKITPQISEGDFLKLKYEITLSSFAEDNAATTLPPSRQTNTLKSEATIPDGHTIVVGGLTRENFMESVDRVPFLGRIPVIEYLLSSRGTSETQTTLFVFLRAVILRDDQFKDLKVLSGHAVDRAGLSEDYPSSEPMVLE